MFVCNTFTRKQVQRHQAKSFYLWQTASRAKILFYDEILSIVIHEVEYSMLFPQKTYCVIALSLSKQTVALVSMGFHPGICVDFLIGIDGN